MNQNELGAKEARKQLQKKLMSNQPKLQVMSLEVGGGVYTVNRTYFLMLKKVLNALIENDPNTMQAQVTAKSLGEDLSILSHSKVG